MRLELYFTLKNPELPIDNKRIWISFLKTCLSKSGGGRFYNQYFEGTPNKDYTFSVILPRPIFRDDIIKLDENSLKIRFSSDDRKRTGLIFFQAFIQAKGKEFALPNDNTMILKKIVQIPERLITSDRVVFRTTVGGGFVIRSHNKETNKDRFYSFEDEGFSAQMKEVLKYQAVNAGFKEEDGEKIKFEPIRCRKVLVKQYGILVDTTCGVFELHGNPELLQYFYQAGLGSKHSMGYGMLDVLSEG